MFKVGDVVKVRTDLVRGSHYGGVYFTSDMERYRGETHEIESVTIRDNFKLDNTSEWTFSPEMLQLVKADAAYKVGDVVEVTRLVGADLTDGVRIGDKFTVESVGSDRVHVINRKAVLGKRLQYPLLDTQIKLVETEEETVMTDKFKVGDKVRVIELHSADHAHNIKVGDVYTVKQVDRDGDVHIRTVNSDLFFMSRRQLEKVVEPTDKYVKVTYTYASDESKGIKAGDVFKVNKKYPDAVAVTVDGNNAYALLDSQIAYVPAPNAEMTFAEMVAKIVAKEIEVGTEIQRGSRTVYVRESMLGRWLADDRTSYFTEPRFTAKDFNGKWKIVEPEPVAVKPEPKVMTVAEINAALGYEVQITE